MKTAQRDAIKAAGGAEYEALLAREREARALFCARHPETAKADRQRAKPWKTHIVKRARLRARKRGMDATITVADIHWPTHCPVLGLLLDYADRSGERVGTSQNPNWPTLDRLDNSRGYVPGNVFVISMRANALKNNATWEELAAVAEYARHGPNRLRAVA